MDSERIRNKQRFLRIVLARGLAAVVLAVALGMLWGWVSGRQAWVLLSPSEAPIQFNTALLFALISVAMALASCPGARARRTAAALCAIAITIATLTLAQYIFRLSLGIDELFFEHTTTNLTPFPGRMAPSTAYAFILAGLAVIAPRALRKALACSLVSVLVLVIVDRAVSREALAITPFTAMAPQTHLLFFLTAIALLAERSPESIRNRDDVSDVRIYFATASLLTVLLAMWLVLERVQWEDRYTETGVAATSLARAFEEQMLHRGNALARLADRWDHYDGLTERQWRGEAQRYLRDFPQINVIVVTDPEFKVRWQASRDANLRSLVGTTLGTDQGRLEAFEAAKAERRPQLMPFLDLRIGQRGTVYTSAIFLGEEHIGYLNASIAADEILDAIAGPFFSGFDVALLDRNGVEAGSQGPDNPASQLLRRRTAIDAFGQDWRIEVWPTQDTISKQATQLPIFVLSFGVFAGLFFAAIVRLNRRQLFHQRLASQTAARLSSTLESMDDGFMTLSSDERIAYVNPRCLELLGHAGESVAGERFRDIAPVDLSAALSEPLQTLLATGTSSSTEAALRDSGIHLAADLHLSPDGVAVFLRDITDRKRSEESARVNEERFHYVAQATSDVIWDWHLSTHSVWWNEGMQTVFGYPKARVETDFEWWTDLIHPDDRADIRRSVEEVISAGRTEWQGQYRIRHASGEYRLVLDRGFVIRNKQGQAIRMVGGINDITEREEAAERMHRAQKMEAFGQLTGGIAHDFNNLLTVILGNAELLCADLADHGQRQLAEMTLAAANRGAELTSRLLAFARRQPLKPTLIDINEMLTGMERLLRRTLEENIDISRRLTSDSCLTEADESQLESAILNLALNARDAMETGGRLTLETAVVSLDGSYSDTELDGQAGEYVLISVSDNGMGMPREVTDRVFEPFFTTKQKDKGTGLGLSMVHGFIKQSGGHVRIYSEPGAGTTVKLYLPRACEQNSTETHDEDIVTPQGGTEHILCVEDEVLVRQHVENALDTLGYRVSSAASGSEALAILEQHPDIELLFTDVIMPGEMNGPELAARALQRRPDLKVLYTSGYTENAIIHRGQLEEGVELLSKPYKRVELAIALHRHDFRQGCAVAQLAARKSGEAQFRPFSADHQRYCRQRLSETSSRPYPQGKSKTTQQIVFFRCDA